MNWNYKFIWTSDPYVNHMQLALGLFNAVSAISIKSWWIIIICYCLNTFCFPFHYIFSHLIKCSQINIFQERRTHIFLNVLNLCDSHALQRQEQES